MFQTSKYAYTCCCRLYCLCTNSTVLTRRSTSFTPVSELHAGNRVATHAGEIRWEKRSLRAEGSNITEHSEGHGEGKEGDMLPHQRDKPYIINKSSVKHISVLMIWLRFLLPLVCLAFSNIFLLKVKGTVAPD